METPATVSVNSDRIRLEPEWKALLLLEFEKPYMVELRAFLTAEMKKGRVIYPEGKNIFNALNAAPPSQVKVVILGQDPYHGPNQAHGFCFSVQKGVEPPPSLKNIFQELKDDMGYEIPESGELTKWAEQGVLLLNTALTVEKSKPLSHQGRGWEVFTDQVIKILNAQDRPVIFILWGSPAQKKEALITNPKHLVIKSPHPSPLSAYRGFFGSKPFTKANEFLVQSGQEPIQWNLKQE